MMLHPSSPVAVGAIESDGQGDPDELHDDVESAAGASGSAVGGLGAAWDVAGPVIVPDALEFEHAAPANVMRAAAMIPAERITRPPPVVDAVVVGSSIGSSDSQHDHNGARVSRVGCGP
jgi:hypothetical protein